MTRRTFWGITTNKSGAVKSTSGLPDAGFKRYSTYHEGVIYLYQAVMGPVDSSYPWESRRPSDTGTSHFRAGSYLPASPASHRADLVVLGFGSSTGTSPEPAHRFGRSLSRASGNRSEEEGRMIASQVAVLDDLLRPPDHSRTDRGGEYEAWRGTSSREGDRQAG